MCRVAACIVALVLLAPSGEAQARLQGSPHCAVPPAPLRLVRFSPDGQYVLAQDDSVVSVLSVQPLAVLFQAPAAHAGSAQFTPDSQQVVFVSSTSRANSQRIALASSPARVERWSIVAHTRIASTEVRPPPCDTEGLSPDGLVLACVDFGGRLRLVDVSSGEPILEVKGFGKQVFSYEDSSNPLAGWTYWGDPGSAIIGFSPDGRFLIAVPDNAEGSPIAFDLRERLPVKLIGGMRKARPGFAFVSPREVMIVELLVGPPTATATLVAFPSGKILLKPKIPAGGRLSRATDPGFVLVHPFGLNAYHDPEAKRTAAVEFKTGQVIVSETPALDVLGNHYVTQLANGDVGLYERGKGLQATVKLPGP